MVLKSRINAPKPHYKCIVCLWRLGFGYDRVARLIRVRRKTVYRIAKRQAEDSFRAPIAYNYLRGRKARIKMPGEDRLRIRESKAAIRLNRRSTAKIKIFLRTKVWKWFKHGLNPKSAPRLVGCTRERFISHIESKLKEGMTMAKYARVWQLDHITPCSKFDLRNSDHVRMCFHFTNYQPMLCHENKVKSARVSEHQPSLAF
jgi:hypothetical protein